MPLSSTAMIRRLVPALLLAPVCTAQAQLPLMTAPAGVLRIELGGAFFPTDQLRIDGVRRELGSRLTIGSLDAAATPLLANAEASLARVLGRASAPLTLGGLTAIAEQQRGVASLGLAVGLTRRLTFAVTVPIVSARTQLQLRTDAAGASAGLNPADASLGTAAGIAQTTAFFTAFDEALTALSGRIASGAFTNPTQLALAQQTLGQGTSLRDGLFTLLADPVSGSAVLPTASSADGTAVLAAITALDATLGGALAGQTISAAPALPAAVLTSSDLDALLAAPTGFGITRPEDIPPVGLGDVELALTAEVLRRGSPGDAHWLGVWARAGARLSTGSAPRAGYLLDQGTGDGQPDVEFGGVAELGRGRFGVRGSALMTLQLSGTSAEQPGTRDQLLRPSRVTALFARNPGDLLTVTAQPFYRIVPHFALTALLQYQRRGADRLAWADPTQAIAGLDLATLVNGTAANATRVGVGLSFVHDGKNREGLLKMPVEAGFSIERTVASSAGVVATPLTSRMVLRVYKPITGR
ncbi:MAG: hypothetical protein KBF28_00075 [Gemmatimonadales bacterium]|nr:hypothetical protein [Gemmatimonadales bacterium]